MTDRTTHQLRTLSTGLIVYGVVGIVLAVVMLGAVVAVGNRLDGIAGKMSSRLTTISAKVARTAPALEHAGTT